LVAGYDSSGGAGPREERCLARRRASAQRNSEPKGATLRLVVSTWARMAIVGRGRRREFCRGEIDAALIGRWRARGWPPWSLTLMKGRAVWVEFNGCLGRARPAGRSTPRGPPPRGVARRGHFVRTTFWPPFKALFGQFLLRGRENCKFGGPNLGPPRGPDLGPTFSFFYCFTSKVRERAAGRAGPLWAHCWDRFSQLLVFFGSLFRCGRRRASPAGSPRGSISRCLRRGPKGRTRVVAGQRARGVSLW